MKPWAWALIILAVISAIGGTYAAGHSSGYDKREAELNQEILAAEEAARLDERNKWAAAVKAAEESIRVETQIVEKIREVEVEVPKVVREIVEVNPECRDLGVDYARLLNSQVRASNGTAEPASGLDGGVPEPE